VLKNISEKRTLVIEYIRNHNTATTRRIRQDTKVKIERVFSNGIREAYKLAGVELPKHLKKRNREECQKIVIEYIKNNPTTTLTKIQNELHINVERLFGGIKQAFDAANVTYPEEQRIITYQKNLKLNPIQKRKIRLFNKKKIVITLKKYTITKKDLIELKKKTIIMDLQQNSLLTKMELDKKYKTNITNLFDGFTNLCKLAGVEFLRCQKRKLKKQKEIIQFIKKNPNSTQWEINKNCRTHVQEIFEGGIREAYKLAGVEYPEKRRKIYGIAIKQIKKRSSDFEKEVLSLMENFGKVKAHVKTKYGIADAILHTNKRFFVVEIKNYLSKPISNLDIKQLEKYLNALNCSDGLIICAIKNSVKNSFKIGQHNIRILTKNELKGLSDSLASLRGSRVNLMEN
jgi:hypothetical protein